MSSTSLLYHAYGLTDQEYLKTEYQGGKVYFHVKTKPDKLRCCNCGSWDVTKKGVLERTFHAPPIGSKQVYVVGHIQRLGCHECGLTRQEEITYAEKKKHTLCVSETLY